MDYVFDFSDIFSAKIVIFITENKNRHFYETKKSPDNVGAYI